MSELPAPTKETKQFYQVTKSQLPLCCPMPGSPIWDMHPKVYLAIEDTPDGKITCPYCGAVYHLVDSKD
ncbi:MAG: zinc-finger domain-containing protein [Pseudomonadota bacterium]